MEQTQIDSYLSIAVRLLHSSAPDSAEKMRNIVEAEILKNHAQTLSGKLTKKQMADLLQQESKAEGSGLKLKKHKTKKIQDLKITTPVINVNQQIIKIRDDDESSENEDEDTAMLLDDLTCKICRQMDNTANNPLLECTDCNQLYHSVCNNTKIPSDTSTFVCSACKSNKKDKEGSLKSTKSSKSYDSSASSSSSVSHKHKDTDNKIKEIKVKEKEIKEKEREKDKKSSSDKKKSESSSSSSRTSSKKESTSSSRSRSSKK